MLTHLPNISYLNLASNMLSGPLPNHLLCGSKLEDTVLEGIQAEYNFQDEQDNIPTGVSSESPTSKCQIHSEAAKLGTQGAPIYKGRLENGTCVAIRSHLCEEAFNSKSQGSPGFAFKAAPSTFGWTCYKQAAAITNFTHNSFINRLYSLTTTNAAYLCPEMCPEKALGWPDRLAILIGVCQGCAFLHTGLSDYGMSIITDEIEKPEAKGMS
ncbi:hypothetical protein D5086_002928 [Populus alba]|uniref:Uncharacterized protein n=1 Tax=Populus alba TaxID=43335 RepID=A0ACC4D3G1_POPAL